MKEHLYFLILDKNKELLSPTQSPAEKDTLFCISGLAGRLFLVHLLTSGAATAESWLTGYGGRARSQLLAQGFTLSHHMAAKTPKILCPEKKFNS